MAVIYFPFICPNCGEKLVLKEKSYVCANNHCFDIAKSGYVNLILANQKNSLDPGDNKEMIDARAVVMKTEYYSNLALALINVINIENCTRILDAGCGIGNIPFRIKSSLQNSIVVGADISKSAITYASKNYKNLPFCVASSNNLPFDNNYFDCLVCAFAPVFSEEFLRVLSQNGSFLRVVPDKHHLWGLKSALYETPYPNELDPIDINGFTINEVIKVNYEVTLHGEEILSLIKMTPYYYHSKKEDIERVCALKELTTNLSFEVRHYKKEC